MPPIRKLYWLWLAFGFAVFAYGLSTGGGPAGWLLYLELRAVGLVFPATHMLLSIPMIFVPIVLLCQDADRRRTGPIDVAVGGKRLGKWFTIAGLVLAGFTALCYWRTTLLPAPGGPPQRVVLDELPAGASVPEQWSVIVGMPQREYAVRYGEAMTGRFRTGNIWTHNFVPITRSDWTPDQPVRFLADTRGASTSSFFSSDRRGLLFRGQLPGYLRMEFRHQGLTIAGDAMVLSTDRDFGRTGWYVTTAFSAIGAFIGLALGWAWPRARARSQQELEALWPRIFRYIAYGIGGILILLSAILMVQKVVHIAGAESVNGVITGVQTSHHGIGKYSFYVKYETPDGRFDRFARTWTPFSKSVGDKVRVIYDSGTPREPEIVAFDDAWMAYLILFVPGAVIVALGSLLFRPKPAKMAYIRRN